MATRLGNFNILCREHYLTDHYNIEVCYYHDHDLSGVVINEIVPKDRFLNDRQYAQYMLDSILKRASIEIQKEWLNDDSPNKQDSEDSTQ